MQYGIYMWAPAMLALAACAQTDRNVSPTAPQMIPQTVAPQTVAPQTVAQSPLPDPPSVLTKIAFGSCADEEQPQPIWQTIAVAF